MNYRIPRTLDNSVRCLGIPFDIAVLFVLIIGTFTTFDHGIVGIVVSVFVTNLYSRTKSKSIKRKLIRIVYWYLPAEINLIKGIQGHNRLLGNSNCYLK